MVDESDVDGVNKQNETQFLTASRKGHTRIVQQLMSYEMTHTYNVNPNHKDLSARTPLHVAVEKRNVECVRFLCQHEAVNVNVPAADVYTPFFKALSLVGYGIQEIIEMLVCRDDIDIDAKPKSPRQLQLHHEYMQDKINRYF